MSYKSLGEEISGHKASSPAGFSWKNWKDILIRVKNQLKTDHVQVVSAGVAFYFFLSLFPMLSTGVSIYGLVTDPAEVQDQMVRVADILPADAQNMVSEILNQLSNKSDQTLGWSLVISILVGLWSAKKGISALFEGINIAYQEVDERGFIKKNLLLIGFTFGGLLVGGLGMLVVVLFPVFIEQIIADQTMATLISWARWIILAAIIVGSFMFLYKKAPDRKDARNKWLLPGAVMAAVIWLTASVMFSWYVNNFGSYDATYGSFAAVIILLLWLFLTAFVIILGAELNAQIEHQTVDDTTVGEDRPLGERQGYYADRVSGEE